MYITQEKENAGRKEELEQLDRQALLDLFIELARRDEESRKKRFEIVYSCDHDALSAEQCSNC